MASIRYTAVLSSTNTPSRSGEACSPAISARAPMSPFPKVTPMRRASLHPASSRSLSLENPSPTIESYSGNSSTALPMAFASVLEITLVFSDGLSVSSSLSSHFVSMRVYAAILRMRSESALAWSRTHMVFSVPSNSRTSPTIPLRRMVLNVMSKLTVAAPLRPYHPFSWWHPSQ